MMDFEQVFRLRQMELKKALREELKELGYEPISRKGFLYAPGDTPVLLVAHLDTVHMSPVETICYSKDGRYVMSPQGIGGDDRAGVWMILQILQKIHCHVLFCEDEESGGIGARAFTRSGIKPAVNYIVELDRKGHNDAVFYGCDNRAFKKFVQEFGFELALGSFSDISVIAPHLKTAAVNISTGYYNAHHTNEVVDTRVMAENIERVTEMLMTPTERFKYGTKPKSVWSHTLFDQQITDMTAGEAEQKFLMPLPEDALLLVNGSQHISPQPYMVDRSGTVYAYIEVLNAAVESDIFAYTSSGNEISFSFLNAKMVKVISYEEAVSSLEEEQLSWSMG